MNSTSKTAGNYSIVAAHKWKPEISHTSSVLSYAILLGGILTIAVTLYMVVITYSCLPYQDGWLEVYSGATGINPLSPTWLWLQHNEHRLVIPKLFLAADLLLFQARQIFLLASIFLIQLLHMTLLGWSMWALGGWRGAMWRTGFGLAAFCLFCPSQAENFVWGFQVCFVLPGLFATLSFIGLLLYWIHSQQQPEERRLWIFLVLSNLAAMGATYSLANGNVLWPLVVGAALYLRLRVAAVLSFVITATISIVLYFHHYTRPPLHANPTSSIQSPARVLEYVAMYLGSSWAREVNHARFIGIAGLGVAILLLARFRPSVEGSGAFSAQLVLILLFCLETAFVTALGRLNFGIVQSFASRYQTVALLFWWSLGLLLLLQVFNGKQVGLRLVLAQVCLLAIMVRAADRTPDPLRAARFHGFQLNVAAIALLTGAYDNAQLHFAFPDQNLLFYLNLYLRNRKLSIFADTLNTQLGEPLDVKFHLASRQECVGVLESATPTEGARAPTQRITGWAWDRRHNEPPSEIVATTNGVITGIAVVGDRRAIVRAANPWTNSSYAGFVGYILDSNASAPANIYAILRGSPPAACYFATR